MENIIYRKANITDLDTLYGFEQGIILAERPFDPTLKDERINYYDLKAIILAEDSDIFVATVNNEVVASASIMIKVASDYLNHDNYAFLGFMYVRPEFRGRGINKGIVKELNNWAEARNLSEIRLKVYKENESALKAYEKAGFQRHIIEMRLTLK
ncbi:MAG: GNAT superfamily N-acetyltransferase [Algoriphagus sp.]|jgi:GNAT superfamily N-acetyltransferase